MIGVFSARPRPDLDTDYVCVGSGPGAPAAAITLVDSGFRVFLAYQRGPVETWMSARQGWTGELVRRWGVPIEHPRTLNYLDELTADTDCSEVRCHPTEPSIPTVNLRSSQGRGTEPTFVGARLRIWAQECLRSQHGTVSTALSLPGARKAVMRDGAAVEVNDVAELPVDGLPGKPMEDWLLARAVERGVAVSFSHPLQRLVFDDSEVVGVVVGHGADERIVRARRAVVLGIGDPAAQLSMPTESMPGGTRLCLIRQTASRFGRLGLLVGNDVGGVRSPYRARWAEMRPRRAAMTSRSARVNR